MSKMFALLLMMSAISFMVVPLSMAGDDGGRYREGSSSGVFSPGYLNAAKYKARHAIDQALSQQEIGVTENAIKHIQNKSQADAKTIQAEKAQVTPALQKKTSSRKAAGTQGIIAQTQAKKENTSKSYGDLDGNGWVDISDLAMVSNNWQTNNKNHIVQGVYNIAADVNSDGVVDNNDLGIVLDHYGTRVPDNIANSTATTTIDQTSAFKSITPDPGLSTSSGNYNYGLQSYYFASTFKDEVSNKKSTLSADAETIAAKLKDNSPARDALAAPVMMTTFKGTELQRVAQGADSMMLKDLTEDQWVMLDVMKAVLSESSKLQNEDGKQAAPDLKQAESELLKAVANVLLGQGVPDLLKKGDAANVKVIFTELDIAKNSILLEYEKSTRPYYDNVIKDIAKNMAMLQAKNLLKASITEEELSKLPPSELDKILEKIRRIKERGFGEDYILQQEAKYRKEYLDPNKKRLEEGIKSIMNNFAGRINDTLKAETKK